MNGFCNNTGYTTATKMQYCYKTCGFCANTTMAPTTGATATTLTATTTS